MAKKSAPDPRFDPRFQRGYDGPQPDAPPTPAVPSPIESGSSRPPVPGAADPSAAGHEAGSPADPVAVSDDDMLWSPPRRNPFAIALLVASLAMMAVGLWLVWTVASASSYPDGNDKAAQALGMVQGAATPALLIAGLLGVIGWLVLGALPESARKGE